MKNLIISEAIQQKISDKHGVCRREVEQCFENRTGRLLLDTREQHQTTPATKWFIAETNKGRWLKVVFVQSGTLIDLKTCYEPNDIELKIYAKHG